MQISLLQIRISLGMAGYLTQGEWNKIFNLIEENPHAEISDAAKLLPSSYRTTMGRALKVAKMLLNQGDREVNEAIADELADNNPEYGVTQSYILNAYRRYQSWLEEKGDRKSLRRLHQDNLINGIDAIRSCLEHPTLNDLPDYRELLEVRGYDWRLDPLTWFYLCAPDFSDTSSWGKEFIQLRSHMDKSPFWEHLEQLKRAVDNLRKDYDRAAVKLFGNDPQLKEFWTRIQIEQLRRERNWHDRPSRTAHTPEPSAEDFKPYYDQDYAKTMMQKLKSTDAGLIEKQLELERMLDQLNDDLLPDEIDPIILSGHCDKCP